SFSNNSTDPDGDLMTSQWDFGDGTLSNEPTPTHTFTSAGSFTVTLVVIDARGMSSEPKRENMTARAGGPVPPTTTTLPPRPATPTTTLPSVSFSRQVQPIFTANCAFPACHTGPAIQKGLDLTTAVTSYASLVNRPSAECPSVFRANPRFPDTSYVIWKLE